MTALGHNSGVVDASISANGEELRAFMEQFERLQAEKDERSDGQKEIMAEAKGRGYDVRIIRKLIAMRKRDKDDLDEEEATLAIYSEALGMS